MRRGGGEGVAGGVGVREGGGEEGGEVGRAQGQHTSVGRLCDVTRDQRDVTVGTSSLLGQQGGGYVEGWGAGRQSGCKLQTSLQKIHVNLESLNLT